MERLTTWSEDGNGSIELESIMDILTEKENIRLAAALTKLAAYEDAEENGTLIKLPCKVGDTVWEARRYENGSLMPAQVVSILIADETLTKSRSHVNLLRNKSSWTARVRLEDFEKDYFLTREEAEKALKERENE